MQPGDVANDPVDDLVSLALALAEKKLDRRAERFNKLQTRSEDRKSEESASKA